MASMQSISAALESVDAKKENLRKAFEYLQSHSSLLSSFTLQWKDLEEHFDSVKKSVEERFNELESKEKASINGSQSLVKESLPPVKEPEKSSDLSEFVPRPEIKSFCINMDGMGLRSYIMSQRKELALLRYEVGVALKLASDPAKLVLDAMLGFFPPNSKGHRDQNLAATRRTCILLLELLMDISPQINPQLKENATKLAIEWKGEISDNGEDNLGKLVFLQLVATYGLVSSFDANDLIDLTVSIARRKQAIDVCRSLGLTERLPDLIQKLIDKGNHLDAVKFACAFELVDRFPPVPLLQDYRNQSKKIANEVLLKGNPSLQSQNEATGKLISALKGIVKCIEDHKLESQFPPGGVAMHILQLERDLSSRKRSASGPATGSKQQQQPQGHQQQQLGNKRPRGPALTKTPSSIANTGLLPVPPLQAEYYHPLPTQGELYHQPGLLLAGPDRVSPYLGGASSAHYGSLSVSAHNTTVLPQYLSNTALAGHNGSGPSSLNHRFNLSPPSRSQLYSFEHHLSSAALHNRSMAQDLGSHGLPPAHHHPSSGGGFGGHVLPPNNHPSYYP